MGVTCSKPTHQVVPPNSTAPSDGLLDPFMHQLEQRSIEYSTGERPGRQGQVQLLHKHQRAVRSNYSTTISSNQLNNNTNNQQPMIHPTRLVIRRRPVRTCEEGMSGTHIYAVRFPADQPLKREMLPQQQASEQAPPRPLTRSEARPRPTHVQTQGLAKPDSNPLQQTQAQTKILVASNSMGSSKGDDKKDPPTTPALDHLFSRETMILLPKQKGMF